MAGKHKQQKQAEVVGSPGVYPRFAAYLRIVFPLLILMLLAGYCLRAAFPIPELSSGVAGFGLVLIAGLLAWTMLSRRTANAFLYERRARGRGCGSGAAAVPGEYTIFHGVMLPGSVKDIDHVVVGPSGVFVVETKNWAGRIDVLDGRVLYNGQEPTRPPVEQARQAAGFLENYLCRECAQVVEVRAALCFAGGGLSGELTGVAGVRLCTAATIAELAVVDEMPLADAVRQQVIAALKKTDLMRSRLCAY